MRPFRVLVALVGYSLALMVAFAVGMLASATPAAPVLGQTTSHANAIALGAFPPDPGAVEGS